MVISALTGALLFALVDASDAASPWAFLAAALAAALLVAATLGALAPGRHQRADATTRGATLRARAQRRRIPRALDPDGRGRPRPRAPSLHLA
ncbi:hypothetical protein GCM10009687_03920 [Asanoa iriomotensis]